MKSELLSLSHIIIVIHAASSANKPLNRKLISLLIYIVCRLLNKQLEVQVKQNDEVLEVRDLHVILKMLKNNGLILEENNGSILLNEKINYILNDLISNKENIRIWRLAYEIAKLSSYTIGKIASYLRAIEEHDVNNLKGEEKEIISELISIIENKVRYLSN